MDCARQSRDVGAAVSLCLMAEGVMHVLFYWSDVEAIGGAVWKGCG